MHPCRCSCTPRRVEFQYMYLRTEVILDAMLDSIWAHQIHEGISLQRTRNLHTMITSSTVKSSPMKGKIQEHPAPPSTSLLNYCAALPAPCHRTQKYIAPHDAFFNLTLPRNNVFQPSSHQVQALLLFCEAVSTNNCNTYVFCG